jgi:plastocyanin
VRPLRWLALCCALAGAAPQSALAQAVIEGTVSLPRIAAPPVSKARYPLAASYTVGPPDPPAAIVYLEGDVPRPTPARAAMGQHHYQFSPGLLAVPRGSVVTFPNLDDEYHSVFSYSKTKRFDLGRYARDETPAELTFEQAGVVRLFCEIHDHMRGTILVLDTPYFTKTDADGRYRLTNLPPGRHLVKAWIDEDSVVERRVELGERSTVRVDFPAP